MHRTNAAKYLAPMFADLAHGPNPAELAELIRTTSDPRKQALLRQLAGDRGLAMVEPPSPNLDDLREQLELSRADRSEQRDAPVLARPAPVASPAAPPEPSSPNLYGLTDRQLNYCEQAGVDPKRYRALLDEEVAARPTAVQPTFGLTERQLKYCRQLEVDPKDYRALLDEERAAAAAAKAPALTTVQPRPNLADVAALDRYASMLIERAIERGNLHPRDLATQDEIRSLARRDRTLAEQRARELKPLLTEQQRAICAQMNVTPAQFLDVDRPVETFGLSRQQLDYCRQAGVDPARYRTLLDEDQRA